MTYVLFLLVISIVEAICAKRGLALPDSQALLIIAILTAGEVIAWSRRK